MIEKQNAIRCYDVVVIGGGINGVGIATDAAGRGLDVLLCEKDDLAQHTSSASSKLIHGGLRYLEHKEFRLVRESLAEREVLLAKAPHLVRPMRFIMPHQAHLRPAWLIRTGLFFYDYLATRKTLAGSHSVKFTPLDSPLKADITQGFEYSDCCVDDARLVVLNALQAQENGADILTQTQCIAAQRQQEYWLIKLKNAHTEFEVRAKALVNATGAWVADFIQDQVQGQSPYRVRLIQGSHIVLPKIYAEENAFIFQNSDQRIVFAIPYLGQYTLIGTTDREYTGQPEQVHIHDDEIDYLLTIANQYFKQQHSHQDIVSSFSGVRALFDDQHDRPSAITRDYRLALAVDERQQLPLLSVFGGKLTTYRKLAEAALSQLSAFFPEMKAPWTAQSVLPGAEQWESFAALVAQLQQRLTDVPTALAQRWASAYGTRVWNMLGQARSMDDLGVLIGANLYQVEVDYLLEHEWAKNTQDILWRRSKLGLQFSGKELAQLDLYLAEKKQHKLQTQIA